MFERIWLFYPFAAILGGSPHVVWLVHDLQKWQAGWMDDLLHSLLPYQSIFQLFYIVGVVGLCFLLAQSVRNRHRRAIWLAILWSGIGLGLAALVGANLDLLQETYNDRYFSRIAPDDYLTWIRDDFKNSPYVIGIFGPEEAPTYTWERMTFLENFWLFVMSCLAAGSLWWARHEPVHAIWATPLTLVFGLFIYVFFAAHWSLMLAWDEFIGDRILGSVAASFFVIGPWLEGSGVVVAYAYVLSMAGASVVWRVIDGTSKHEAL